MKAVYKRTQNRLKKPPELTLSYPTDSGFHGGDDRWFSGDDSADDSADDGSDDCDNESSDNPSSRASGLQCRFRSLGTLAACDGNELRLEFPHVRAAKSESKPPHHTP